MPLAASVAPLRAALEQQDATLLAVRPEVGECVFSVEHFSKYTLPPPNELAAKPADTPSPDKVRPVLPEKEPHPLSIERSMSSFNLQRSLRTLSFGELPPAALPQIHSSQAPAPAPPAPAVSLRKGLPPCRPSPEGAQVHDFLSRRWCARFGAGGLVASPCAVDGAPAVGRRVFVSKLVAPPGARLHARVIAAAFRAHCRLRSKVLGFPTRGGAADCANLIASSLPDDEALPFWVFAALFGSATSAAPLLVDAQAAAREGSLSRPDVLARREALLSALRGGLPPTELFSASDFPEAGTLAPALAAFANGDTPLAAHRLGTAGQHRLAVLAANAMRSPESQRLLARAADLIPQDAPERHILGALAGDAGFVAARAKSWRMALHSWIHFSSSAHPVGAGLLNFLSARDDAAAWGHSSVMDALMNMRGEFRRVGPTLAVIALYTGQGPLEAGEMEVLLDPRQFSPSCVGGVLPWAVLALLRGAGMRVGDRWRHLRVLAREAADLLGEHSPPDAATFLSFAATPSQRARVVRPFLLRHGGKGTAEERQILERIGFNPAMVSTRFALRAASRGNTSAAFSEFLASGDVLSAASVNKAPLDVMLHRGHFSAAREVVADVSGSDRRAVYEPWDGTTFSRPRAFYTLARALRAVEDMDGDAAALAELFRWVHTSDLSAGARCTLAESLGAFAVLALEKIEGRPFTDFFDATCDVEAPPLIPGGPLGSAACAVLEEELLGGAE
eukprot:gnl/Chilomastix_cuspidata/2502.p1 GENE.gnl/Chilomastix_cuspidata/2502~~gnl/Chilomastix_cuspidata/2502.p1  ORF type:complete len:734 (-),score=237.14 gnl/Chilomastix_cuspidata/2502:1910-4111(-)